MISINIDSNNISLLQGRTNSTNESIPTQNSKVQIIDPSEVGKLDQNDFLNMLLTQLQNQDPMNPMDNTEFASQLAQYSSLEQLTSIGGKIDTITQLILTQMSEDSKKEDATTDKENKPTSGDTKPNKENLSEGNTTDTVNKITLRRDFLYDNESDTIQNLNSKLNQVLSKQINNTYLNGRY